MCSGQQGRVEWLQDEGACWVWMASPKLRTASRLQGCMKAPR
eukprot:CAMPEP_0174325896 /NCGR_PEP_ID=MMETSP0810-20121108/13551_1 /TAXON_ID=73025 ORGANISM="Eutreptiella gymnastica-like, Strain CCMP1594" /NCGR_SAMPLE_ID=MMETSP0810 /ASSEMBLY_ACC=CAM_ASM_000659 /LENGTH=41 /DNA_ID= /DNA_START= /DNA_END= /DNA_ORIENTATION=